ncbi:Tbc2 translation factor, chloroplastic [Porphyridium purpureum]|uniref:Tbc2 translation factor, chloroplastic n=1 Tax=Porphyridium purpureum TaxID=35688 RepID=A0A5J4Z4X8_PORPP|nr:Tbc2 translation factor, chloroplastic [Porphyridium purpureum]|eukprot:POR5191..scf295_1
MAPLDWRGHASLMYVSSPFAFAARRREARPVPLRARRCDARSEVLSRTMRLRRVAKAHAGVRLSADDVESDPRNGTSSASGTSSSSFGDVDRDQVATQVGQKELSRDDEPRAKGDHPERRRNHPGPAKMVFTVFRRLENIPSSEKGQHDWFVMLDRIVTDTRLTSKSCARALRLMVYFSQRSHAHASKMQEHLPKLNLRKRLDKDKFLAQLPYANDITLCNLVHAMASLDAPSARPTQKFVDAWFDAAGDLSSFSAQGLANAIWAWGKLEIPLPDSFLNSWYQGFQREISNFTPQNLSNSIYALACLGIVPDQERFLNLFVSAFKRNVNDFKPQHLANTLWAISKLGAVPQRDFVSFWFAGFDRALNNFNHTELSSIFWAFGNMAQTGYQPPSIFMKKLTSAFENDMSRARGRELAAVMWALGQLDLKPEMRFLDAWMRAFRRNIGTANSQALTNVIWALSKLELRPAADFVAAWKERYMSCDDQTGAGLSSALYALARLSITPEVRFLEFWYRSMIPCLPSADGHTLSQSMYAFGRLDIVPAEEFLTQWLGFFELKLEHVNQQDLSLSLWALARLDIRPDEVFLNKWTEAFVRQAALEEPLEEVEAMVTWACEKMVMSVPEFPERPGEEPRTIRGQQNASVANSDTV